MDNIQIPYDIFYIIILKLNDLRILCKLKMTSKEFKKYSQNRISKYFKEEWVFIKLMKQNLRLEVIENFYNNFRYLPIIKTTYIYRLNILRSIYMMIWKNYLDFNQLIMLNFDENEWCCDILEKFKFNICSFYDNTLLHDCF